MMYLDDLAEAIRRAVPDDALPEGDTSPLFRMYAVLMLAKGDQVTAADVHNAWVAWMAGENISHDSLVPFVNLDIETQAEDAPYLIAIRQVVRRVE